MGGRFVQIRRWRGWTDAKKGWKGWRGSGGAAAGSGKVGPRKAREVGRGGGVRTAQGEGGVCTCVYHALRESVHSVRLNLNTCKLLFKMAASSIEQCASCLLYGKCGSAKHELRGGLRHGVISYTLAVIVVTQKHFWSKELLEFRSCACQQG